MAEELINTLPYLAAVLLEPNRINIKKRDGLLVATLKLEENGGWLITWNKTIKSKNKKKNTLMVSIKPHSQRYNNLYEVMSQIDCLAKSFSLY